MTQLPSLRGKELMARLKKAGFEVIRIKCSHHFIRHNDGRSSVIPVHGGEDIGPGLMATILRDCELSHEQPQEFL